MNYEQFLELARYRRSVRKFKPDPIPDDYVTKILDAAHYAMSGANSQPWEFIVVKNPETRKKIFEVYRKQDLNRIYHIEQQRSARYRHPAFNVAPEEKDMAISMIASWGDAPVLIAVLADPRKQLGSVAASFADISVNLSSVCLASMCHLHMMIHLAAASLGLGSQRVDVIVQEPFRQILGYPEPVRLDTLVPVGYRAYELGPPHRLPLKKLVHYEKYDMAKYLKDEDFLKYLDAIHALGRPGYRVAIGESKG
ncbi:MAG: nitroreductase family protein [Chloroflexi bacterium]|nr:nitroreductase family protein [Chloroflexota bacterium]